MWAGSNRWPLRERSHIKDQGRGRGSDRVRLSIYGMGSGGSYGFGA